MLRLTVAQQHGIRINKARIFYVYQRHRHVHSLRMLAQWFSYAEAIRKGNHMYVDFL